MTGGKVQNAWAWLGETMGSSQARQQERALENGRWEVGLRDRSWEMSQGSWGGVTRQAGRWG